MIDENNQTETPSEIGEGEGQDTGVETIAVPKSEYEKLNQTIGSMKRQIKDLTKPKEEPKETPQKTEPDQSVLLQKTFLRAAQITAEDEVELALTTAKKWDMPIDKLVDDDDFKEKLEKFRTKKSNELATSNIRGSGQGTSEAKNTPGYWIAKGVPPTADQVPDRKTRAKIARAMIEKASTNGKTFYNDK